VIDAGGGVPTNGNSPREADGCDHDGGGIPTSTPAATSSYTFPPVFLLSNETPELIEVATCEGRVRLAPLEEDREFVARRLTADDASALRHLMLQQKVRLEAREAPAPETSPLESAMATSVVVGVVAATIVGLTPWQALGAAAVGFVGMAAFHALRKSGQDAEWTLLIVSRHVVDRLGLIILLLAALAVAVVAPAVAVYFGTGLDDVLRWNGGRFVVDPNAHALIVARSLQVGLIGLASLLPALMFFQFRRERFLAIRKRMLHDVFRLDNRLRTLADMKARYGSQLDMLMDSPTRRSGSSQWRSHGGSCTPLLAATFAISLGWVLILLDMSEVVNQRSPSVSLAGLINPDASAFSFAFLGAYFFAVELVLRGYVRGDLTPKTYNTITTRILVALILAWLFGSLLGEEDAVARVLAFVSGIVPATGLHWIRDRMPHLKVLSTSAALQDEIAPLTDLEGIDLYDRTRLTDEGITNIQALAHHNLVELMHNTRIPVPRLVDWVDQAILYLHVVAPATLRESYDGREAADGHDLLRNLRAYGIRTATDLIQVVRRAERRGETRRGLLAQICGEGDIAHNPSRLEVALDSLLDDEWMGCLRGWRDIPDEEEPPAATRDVDLRAQGDRLPHPVGR